jgi:hypothetical protein
MEYHTAENMVKWYKRDGDDKLPNKKQDLIARYLATRHRGEMLSPVLPEGFEAEIAPQTVTDEEDVARILLGAASYRSDDITAALLPAVMDNAGIAPPLLENNEEDVARILLGAASYHSDDITAPATSV